VFLVEVVIMIAIEGIRLVATKKPGIVGIRRRHVARVEDPGTPTLPVEIGSSRVLVVVVTTKPRLVIPIFLDKGDRLDYCTANTREFSGRVKYEISLHWKERGYGVFTLFSILCEGPAVIDRCTPFERFAARAAVTFGEPCNTSRFPLECFDFPMESTMPDPQHTQCNLSASV